MSLDNDGEQWDAIRRAAAMLAAADSGTPQSAAVYNELAIGSSSLPVQDQVQALLDVTLAMTALTHSLLRHLSETWGISTAELIAAFVEDSITIEAEASE